MTPTKEPNKDFRKALLDIIACPICLKQRTSCTLCLDEADRILAICKETLVPYEVTELLRDSKGWNACRQHILKQLGEK